MKMKYMCKKKKKGPAILCLRKMGQRNEKWNYLKNKGEGPNEYWTDNHLTVVVIQYPEIHNGACRHEKMYEACHYQLLLDGGHQPL